MDRCPALDPGLFRFSSSCPQGDRLSCRNTSNASLGLARTQVAPAVTGGPPSALHDIGTTAHGVGPTSPRCRLATGRDGHDPERMSDRTVTIGVEGGSFAADPVP